MRYFLSILLCAASLSANVVTPEEQNVQMLEKEVAADPENLDLRYDLALAYNDYAMLAEEDANEEALDKAEETFRYIYEQDPSRLEAKAMLGSTYVLRARFVSVFTKIKWAKKGFVVLDEAVEADPTNADLRLIRGANSAQVPGFLGRSDEADEDFAWLIHEMDTRPEAYEDGLRRSAYFYAGEYALKKDDKSAINLLLQASRIPGEARLDHRIADTLAQARQAFPKETDKTGDS